MREFRFLWAGEVLSVLGDQLARVALAVLVFDRTHSALLTGLTYALTFVPAFLGGALFGSLGDRHPRRTVMVVADGTRAVLIGLAAVPGMPIWSLCVLVAATTLVNGPFKAAQQALLPTVLSGPLYTRGMAVRNISMQTAQLGGFAAGGLLVAAWGTSWALALDAGSFGLSAVLVRAGVVARAAVSLEGLPFVAAMRQGAELVLRDPALRTLTALVWLAGFYVAPEALAAPYAASLGGGSLAVGLVMASDPAGSVLGGIVVGGWVPEAVQHRVVGWLGIAAGLPLGACLLRPALPVSMVLFALSGAAATAYTIYGVADFTRRLPEARRAQGAGLLSAGLATVQGVGALAGGVVSDALGPAHAVGCAGLVGAAIAVPIAVAWARHRASPPLD